SSASAGSSGAAIAEDIRPTLAAAATARDAIVRLVRRVNREDMLFSPFPCFGTSVSRLHVTCDTSFSILIIAISEIAQPMDRIGLGTRYPLMVISDTA